MACGLALKRPHDYDSYLVEEGFATEAKRARHSTHCSPFRPQMGTIAASLPSTSNFTQSIVKREVNSAFADVAGCQLTSAQIGAYLRSEIRNLKRRRLIPKRTLTDSDHSADENSPMCNYRTPTSPAQYNSDSEGECAAKASPNKFTNLNEKPQFSLKQVQLICERLLKEQEIRLRQEYETALNQRLDEQHQQYVQFAEEQLAVHNREKNGVDLSYLS